MSWVYMIMESNSGGDGLWVHMSQPDLKFVISEDGETISEDRVGFQRIEGMFPCQY